MTIIDAEDVSSLEDVDKVVQKYFRRKFEMTSYSKLTILQKLHLHYLIMSVSFFIHDSELTRAGEYVELTHLVMSEIEDIGRKEVFFMKREGFPLSEMA